LPGGDIDFLQLVDQDHRRIAVRRDVAGRDLDPQRVLRPIAELFMISRAAARFAATSGP
jgi:hypothetical protein